MRPSKGQGYARGVVYLRGHHLICIPGFRGLGYSDSFIANLSDLKEGLEKKPETWIEVVEGPDDICQACPHLDSCGCRKDGPRSEEEIRLRDREVLKRLGLEPGIKQSWSSIMDRVASSFSPAVLEKLCFGCPWFSLGYCQDALIRLKTQDSKL